MMTRLGRHAVVLVISVLALPCLSAEQENTTAAQAHAMRPQPKSIKDLLEHIAQDEDVNAPYASGLTPLFYAVNERSADGVAALLDKGANPNATEQHSGITPLMFAVTRGSPEIVKLLLESGADPNLTTTEYHATALMDAAKAGQADCARYLLDHGAESDLRDHFGATALLLARQNGHLSIVNMLEDAGATLRLYSEAPSKEDAEIIKLELQWLQMAVNMWAITSHKGRDEVPAWKDLCASAAPDSPLCAREGYDVFKNPYYLGSAASGPKVSCKTVEMLEPVTGNLDATRKYWGSFLPEDYRRAK